MSKSALPAVIVVGVGGYFIYKTFPQSSISLAIAKLFAAGQNAVAGVQTAPAIADGTRGPAAPVFNSNQSSATDAVQSLSAFNGGPQGIPDDAAVSLAAFNTPWNIPTMPDLNSTFAETNRKAQGLPNVPAALQN